MGTCIYVLNWLQQTLLRSAMRCAETEFSIKLVHRRRGMARSCLTCPTRESILRAREETSYCINREYFFQIWKPIFKLEDLVFNTHYSSSMY